MLSSIRDKLLNVTKTVPLFNNTKDAGSVQCQVNLNSGCEILSRYQKEWETLHRINEDNAKKAEDVAEDIAKITKKIERDKKSLSTMTYLLTNSNVQSNIANCAKQIERLHEGFSRVEEDLLLLEDLIENVQFENMKKQHRYHLRQYKLRKSASLESFEAGLKEEHAKTVTEHELKKKQELEERQRVFHEAFKSDLEIFKNLGTIPKLDLPKKQPSALLEEIQVDYDENELNRFFEDNPSNHVE